ncbi:hypothetical protein K488DRAFT_39762 [Vararia minispora EC-137]|uniref:Uncharacterized protein n=1 Tax=Vararia minispora EC-137 TaxID=1314806 RepID=A0ACB8R0B6_9AGAM|nr:hypothetical protein K488DRAFT_39762 [Vararia minispora EC-137]
MADFPIVYHIANAQQFWSELDDTLYIPNNASLSILDAILKRFIRLCATHHEQYLQSPMQLEHAINLLLDSELFSFHSERMCEILSDEARTTTDPHRQLITYNVLLHYGRRNVAFFRSYKRWQPIFPLLMDHVLVDLPSDLDLSSDSDYHSHLAEPIEAKLRALSVRLLYEVCRTSKLSLHELRIFDEAFIERLFELVELTRAAQDESFNYSVIKLIVAFNEQFMVASIKSDGKDGPKTHPANDKDDGGQGENRVLRVLRRRLASSPTFGQSMVFMLNRAGRSPEDLVMQLLVLKLLYLLFTSPGTCEYFYTNDLCVLVDVFLRELSDLDDDAESLRHTYLRVLHPLLTKTQLRNVPYKRPQLAQMLESLVAHPDIREINLVTKRLVARCLSGDWRVGAGPSAAPAHHHDPRHEHLSPDAPAISRTTSPGITSPVLTPQTAAPARPALTRQRSLKGSRSVENLRTSTSSAAAPRNSRLEVLRTAHSNESASSLPAAVGGHSSGHHGSGARDAVVRANSAGTVVENGQSPGVAYRSPTTPGTPMPSILEPRSPHAASTPTRRRAPPPPVRRRKPPAVPSRGGLVAPGGTPLVNGMNGKVEGTGTKLDTIRSSNSAPVVGRAA